MTILSTGPFSVSPFVGTQLYTPFVLYGELRQTDQLTFGGDTRWEKIRALEKVSNIIETQLRNEDIDIAYPVKFTNQFGNEPARVTINGNWNHDNVTSGTTPPLKIADDVDRINTNVVYTGQGAFNSADLIPSSDVDDIVSEIKSWFESVIGDFINVMTLEVNGILYGRRGRHFPNT